MFRRATRLCDRIHLWPLRRDDHSGVLIGAGGRRRSDWPARVLAIDISNRHKPYRQCAKAAKSANLIMRAIKASFMNITPTFFDKLYGTFIRPTWNTHSKPGGRGLERTLSC